MDAISQLNTIIKQMASGITQKKCSSLIEALSQLDSRHKALPEAGTLINMLTSLANYLNSRIARAHPAAVPTLESIFSALESVVSKPDTDRAELQDIVKNQLAIYRQLQNKLSSRPPEAAADIENMKAVILAIDWEITEQTLNNFEVELSRQMERFREYNIHHTFLKIIQSIGRYVASYKAKAHADSIFFLRSVFNNFELLILTPDMALKEKKQLLEADLKKFQTFKIKIRKPPSPAVTRDNDIDENLSPALSHVKPTSHVSSDGDEGSLTSLDDDAGTTVVTTDDPTPALSQKAPAQNGSTDVMGDLFNIKESPADELLDAIHLLDVHGSNPDQALNMLDAADGGQTEGVKNYTPERSDTDPIPEIGSRLDAFFNLDAPDAPPNAPEKTPLQAMPNDAHPAADSDCDEGIVPFEHDRDADEIVPDPDEPPDDEPAMILERLRTNVNGLKEKSDASSGVAVSDDLALLKTRYKNNVEKSALIEILDSLFTSLYQSELSDQPDSAIVEKKGFWQKLKSLFSG